MSQPKALRTYYGDLHFHTHYSDNRDRASVGEMVGKGRLHGIGIFGTGDHNHNVTRESFAAEQEETAAVRRSFPDLLIMNNCEMTFLMGHYLVFAPSSVSGTIDEAYHYLYGAHNRLVMANHPGLPSDEWNTRIVPGIAAIEVVNGAVLHEAAARGARAASLLDVPAIGIYVRYLALGHPVAVLGSSDAHALEELGSGCTGFHFDGPPDTEMVLDAIRRRRTFATTRTGVDLRWEVGDGVLEWSVVLPEGVGEKGGVTLELYNSSALVERWRLETSSVSGEFRLGSPGLYWLGMLSGENLIVSSPIEFRLSELEPAAGELELAARGADVARRERAALALNAEQVRSRPGRPSGARSVPVDLRLLHEGSGPVLTDRKGRAVAFTPLERTAARRVIDKECAPEGFAEFYTWLERNEIHEYRFASISYELDGSLFRFSAQLIPYRCDKRSAAGKLFSERIDEIKALVARSERVRILVTVAPTILLRLDARPDGLPLSVSPPLDGAPSLVTALDDGAFAQFFV